MSTVALLKPRVSEKTYAQSEQKNVFVFDVPKEFNRTQVKDAVQAQFKVTVTGVNILNVKGKEKRSYRRTSGWSKGKRNDVKKAYVTLKAGDSIAIFASEEDAPKAPKADKKGKK
jgi:large subunit ribosomal protein L23